MVKGGLFGLSLSQAQVVNSICDITTSTNNTKMKWEYILPRLRRIFDALNTIISKQIESESNLAAHHILHPARGPDTNRHRLLYFTWHDIQPGSTSNAE